jgi:hypothetical protein
VTHKEKDQAQGYARELRRSGRIGQSVPILCYVLGATIEPGAEATVDEGATRIIPRRYSDVLGQADARTFRLLQKIEASKAVRLGDPDLEDIVHQEELPLPMTARSAPPSPTKAFVAAPTTAPAPPVETALGALSTELTPAPAAVPMTSTQAVAEGLVVPTS